MYILSSSLSERIHGSESVKEYEEYLKEKTLNAKLSKIEGKSSCIGFDCLYVRPLTCTFVCATRS